MHDAECDKCNLPVQKVQQCTTPELNQEPNMTFQVFIFTAPRMLHFVLWALMHLRFLKSHFINVPINIQSFKVLSHPATSGNGRKDLLHAETL